MIALAEDRFDDADMLYPEAPYLDWHGDDRAYLNLLAVMAWGRLRHGAFLDAWFVSGHVLQYLPDWALPRLTFAQALEGLGRTAEACAAYRQVLELCPEHPGARAALRRLEGASAARGPG